MPSHVHIISEINYCSLIHRTYYIPVNVNIMHFHEVWMPYMEYCTTKGVCIENMPTSGSYLFMPSLATGLLSPGPGDLPYCWLSLWPWTNKPETNDECFTKILKLSGVCWEGTCRAVATRGGTGDPAMFCAVKKSKMFVILAPTLQ